MTKKIQITFASIFALALLVSLFTTVAPTQALISEVLAPPISITSFSCTADGKGYFSCTSTVRYVSNPIYGWIAIDDSVHLKSSTATPYKVTGNCSTGKSGYTSVTLSVHDPNDYYNSDKKGATFYCPIPFPSQTQQGPSTQVTPSPIK